MLKSKCFEVRDEGTFIPILATQLSASNDNERRLLNRAGYSGEMKYLLLTNLNTADSSHDPFGHSNSRTLREAHIYILNNFDALADCAVIDVQYILGETSVPKRSEIN